MPVSSLVGCDWVGDHRPLAHSLPTSYLARPCGLSCAGFDWLGILVARIALNVVGRGCNTIGVLRLTDWLPSIGSRNVHGKVFGHLPF